MQRIEIFNVWDLDMNSSTSPIFLV